MASQGPKRRNLGRGLDALLGGQTSDSVTVPGATAQAPPPAPGGTAEQGWAMIQIGRIRSSRYQPRRRFDEDELESLTQSVREIGVVQPVLVRPHPEEAAAYELIAGERRWMAAQRAQLHEIPAVIKDISDPAALEIALVENIQRQDLTPLEEAEGYQRLMQEFAHTQEDLANVVGKSRSHVANMMRLLSLPDSVKDMLDQGDLTAGHARTLLGLPDPVAVAQKIVTRGLSVRDAEKLARSERLEGVREPRRAPTRKPDDKPVDILALERELTDQLGLAVEIRHGDSGGEFIIRYKTLEQLDDVLSRIARKPH